VFLELLLLRPDHQEVHDREHPGDQDEGGERVAAGQLGQQDMGGEHCGGLRQASLLRTANRERARILSKTARPRTSRRTARPVDQPRIRNTRLNGCSTATGTSSFPALATGDGPSRLAAGPTARRRRISPWLVSERRSTTSLALPDVGGEGREPVLGDGLPRPSHQRKVVVEVVEGGQPQGQELVGGKKGPEVGTG